MIVSADNINDHLFKKRIYIIYRIEWSKAPINIYTSLLYQHGAKKENGKRKEILLW